jgi:hypothetical protein
MAMVASFFWFGYLKEPGMLVAAVAGCLGALAMLRFATIKRLKTPGIQIEMDNLAQARQRADAAAEAAQETAEAAQTAADDAHKAFLEAKASITDLRSLSADLAYIAMSAFSNVGRLGGERIADRLARAHEVEARLKQLGCTEEEIARATSRVYFTVQIDLANDAMQELSKNTPPTFWPEHGQAFLDRCSKERRPLTPSELRELMDIAKIPSDSSARRSLARYEAFATRRELPDPLPELPE